MSHLASIHIFHLRSGIRFDTVEETASSFEEARAQFSKLAEVISSMEQDNHSIVLETTEGYVILSRKFLSDSILRLKLNQVEGETDVNAG